MLLYRIWDVEGKTRNDGLGDYREHFDGVWDICATRLSNPRFTDLILIHEFIETILIRAAGIPEPDIDAFDAQFEELRGQGFIDNDAEPGDDQNAPYYQAHQIATRIEKIACEALGLSWTDYEKECENV